MIPGMGAMPPSISVDPSMNYNSTQPAMKVSVPFDTAVICASNQNRSMASHELLARSFSNVRSFGTGNKVKLPGPSMDRPNVYDFGTPYRDIHNDLTSKDPKLYRANGLLVMLERNMNVKRAPEKWQENQKFFDIVVTFEERVFEMVLEDFRVKQVQNPNSFRVSHVFNIETKDNANEAQVGAQHSLVLVQLLAANPNWRDELDDILEEFTRLQNKDIIHALGVS